VRSGYSFAIVILLPHMSNHLIHHPSSHPSSVVRHPLLLLNSNVTQISLWLVGRQILTTSRCQVRTIFQMLISDDPKLLSRSRGKSEISQLSKLYCLLNLLEDVHIFGGIIYTYSSATDNKPVTSAACRVVLIGHDSGHDFNPIRKQIGFNMHDP